MAFALTIFALLITLLSLWGVALPSKLVAFVRSFMHQPAAVPAASALRLVLALLLWFSAPDSRTPDLFRLLAILAFVAAIALPLIGRSRLMVIIDRFSSWPGPVLRLWCLFGVAFGVFLLWSVYPAIN